MSNPEISVLLPVYNDESTIDDALESVLNQTFDRYEVIVVDDGSTDRSAEIVREYTDDAHVRLVSHETNQGLPVALNTGLEAAEGKFVARQDADDISYPNRVETQYQYLTDNPDVTLVATGVDVINEEGKVTDSFAPPDDPTTAFEKGNPIVHGSIMARRNDLVAVGGYDEFFKYCQDYDLWSRLAESGYHLRGLSKRLYRMRRESESLSVEWRKRYVIYAAMARTPTEKTTELKEVARRYGLEAVIPNLDDKERANIHRRLVYANLENNQRTAAIRAAIRGCQAAPFTIRSYAHVALTVAPPQMSRFAINRIKGR